MTEEKLNLRETDERWQFILSSMIIGDPFVHEFLMMMSKVEDMSIKTMGVRTDGSRIILAYNPYFLMKLTNEEARWVLSHEVLHVALHHCTLRSPGDPKQNMIWNYAMDLAVNQLIPDNGRCTKPRAEICTPLHPDQFGFDHMLSMEQYLQLLWKKEQEEGNGGQGEGDGDPKGQGEGDGDPKGQDNNNGITGIPKGPGGGEVIDDHSKFEESDVLDQVIRDKVEQMQNQSKFWGSMPGNVKAAIEAAQRSQISWVKLLRHHLGRFAVDEREPTIMRPNRRFGFPYTGTTTKHVERVLWCEDTSGSMSDRALAKGRSEANKALQYMPIDMVQFDTKIRYGPEPFNKKTKRFNVMGRGGTCFQDVMDLAEKGRYKAVVVITDGVAAAINKPKHVRDVIWCIIEGNKPPVPWGKVVKVKDTPF